MEPAYYELSEKIFFFFLQGIQSDLSAFKISIHSSLGDNTSTIFWYDNWVLGQAPRFLCRNKFTQSHHTWRIVNDLSDPLRSSLPLLAQISVDLSTFSLQRDMPDSKFWSKTSNVIFTVKSFYSFLIDKGQRCFVTPRILKSPCP